MQINSDYLRPMELRVMGGEPTLHPRFIDVITEACKHYGLITIFTNGTKMKEITKYGVVVKNHFRGQVRFTINGFVFDPEVFHEYVDFISQVILHFVVPLKGLDKLIEKVTRCRELAPYVHFMFSPDTQVDLFDDDILNEYRKVWVDAVTATIPELKSRNISSSYDHTLPMCFYTQDMLDVLSFHGLEGIHYAKITCCGDTVLGLIDYNFDLYYCNQTRIKIGSILKDNGDVKTMDEINSMIQSGSRIKTDSIIELSEKCKECSVVASCKVGCYYNVLVGR
jgi:radical SAM protein with 4Fe4S-binding SPASM domain